MEPRHYESGASESAPTAPETPSVGYPTAGNPGTGTPATKPGPFWFHQIGESLRNVITFAGLTPSDGDLTLLRQAIKLIGKPIKSYLFATNGYVVFDGGDDPDFIIQWFSYNSGVGGTGTTATFPIAFPNQCLAVFGTDASSNNISGTDISGEVAVNSTSYTTTTVGVYTDFTANLLAIGY